MYAADRSMTNGAGKSTTLNLFLDFIRPTSGWALVNGVEVRSNPAETRRHIAYVSENVMLYGDFTARENLDFFTRLTGKRLDRRDYYQAMRRVGLPEESFERKLKTFSKGMRQKVEIAALLLKDADNMVMDEPTSGVDATLAPPPLGRKIDTDLYPRPVPCPFLGGSSRDHEGWASGHGPCP